MNPLASFPQLTGAEPCQQPDADPEWWTGDDPTDRVAAQLYCMRCPTRLDCLAWALDHPKDAGDTIWAATSRNRRKELRREFAIIPTRAEEPK